MFNKIMTFICGFMMFACGFTSIATIYLARVGEFTGWKAIAIIILTAIGAISFALSAVYYEERK